jgi:hypothetical protein
MSIKPTVTAARSAQDLLAAGPRPWRTACSLVAEAAAEVAHAHAKGMLHLSLSPELIALDERSRYDGILEELENGETPSTLNYTAPEVFADVTPDERADVYSLAAILLALLSGRAPFSARNHSAQATIVRVVRDVPDLNIPGAPDELLALLDVALRKDPSQRQLSAAEFARATEAMAVGRSVKVSTHAPQSQAPPDATPVSSGSGINWVAGGLAVALFFGVIFVGAVAAKMQGGDDVGIELVRSEVRAIPEAGGVGSTTSVVAATTTPAAQPDDAAPATDSDASAEADAAGSDADDDGGSTAAAFLSQLDTTAEPDAGTESVVVDESDTADDAPAVEVAAAVETGAAREPTEEQPEEPVDEPADQAIEADAGVAIVPILKSVLDEFELTIADPVDENVLTNDTLGGRDATVTLVPDALLPSGFLLAPNGRLFGVARECGVTETGYTVTTTDGAASTTAIRIVVTGCT